MSASYYRSVLYAVVETKVPTINRPPNCVIWLNENAYQSTDRYFGESVLPRCFQMVGKSIAQRLAKIFSTFDNGIVQRLAMVLSNV